MQVFLYNSKGIFFHECQLGVGRWSIMGKVLSTQLKNGLLWGPGNLPACLPAPCLHPATTPTFSLFFSLTCHLSWFYMRAVSDQKEVFPSVFKIPQGGFSENFHHKLKPKEGWFISKHAFILLKHFHYFLLTCL